MQFRTWLPAVGVVAMLASAAHGQARGMGFFSPAGVAAFTPEVDVVSSGVINDVQAVVSSDRKYVTLNMRPSSTNLIALRNFTFQNGSGLGFVGSSGPNANGNVNAVGAGGAGNVNNVGGAGRAAQAARAQAPAAAPAKPSVLDTPGMTRLG